MVRACSVYMREQRRAVTSKQGGFSRTAREVSEGMIKTVVWDLPLKPLGGEGA